MRAILQDMKNVTSFSILNTVCATHEGKYLSLSGPLCSKAYERPSFSTSVRRKKTGDRFAVAGFTTRSPTPLGDHVGVSVHRVNAIRLRAKFYSSLEQGVCQVALRQGMARLASDRDRLTLLTRVRRVAVDKSFDIDVMLTKSTTEKRARIQFRTPRRHYWMF